MVMGVSIKWSWVFPLNVIHRPSAAASLPRLRDQLAERHSIDHLRDRLGDLEPELREVRRRAALKRHASAFHRAQHRADRDVSGIARQMIPSRGAALGCQKPGAFERQQDLLEITLRDGLTLGD